MSNPLTKYICTNAACESYYEATLIEFSQDEVIPGETSETCCPKCGFVLTPIDYYLEEKKKEKNRRRKKLIKKIAYGVIGLLLITVIILMLPSKKSSEQKPKVPTTKIQQEAKSEQAAPIKPEPKKIDALQLLINEADLMFSNKEYANAKQKYQKVLALDSGNKHATNQLRLIEKILSQGKGELPASSLEEYFAKIADKSIPYNDKDKLKSEVISKYFADEAAMVTEIGINDTEVKHTMIRDYVEVLSQQYYTVKIVRKEMNTNNKITKLYIKEQ